MIIINLSKPSQGLTAINLLITASNTEYKGVTILSNVSVVEPEP
jgi:hypothetical protein